MGGLFTYVFEEPAASAHSFPERGLDQVLALHRVWNIKYEFHALTVEVSGGVFLRVVLENLLKRVRLFNREPVDFLGFDQSPDHDLLSCHQLHRFQLDVDHERDVIPYIMLFEAVVIEINAILDELPLLEVADEAAVLGVGLCWVGKG